MCLHFLSAWHQITQASKVAGCELDDQNSVYEWVFSRPSCPQLYWGLLLQSLVANCSFLRGLGSHKMNFSHHLHCKMLQTPYTSCLRGFHSRGHDISFDIPCIRSWEVMILGASKTLVERVNLIIFQNIFISPVMKLPSLQDVLLRWNYQPIYIYMKKQ